MHLTLEGDSFGRVVAAIAHDGAQGTVTASDACSALTDLRSAVESALADGLAECFWQEAMVVYRWLFRREGDAMRVVVIQSSGTLTGWEHCFWAECGVEEFRKAMVGALFQSPATAP